MRPWNEIYKGTTTLSKPWDVACDENAQVQSFGDRPFNVHGVLLSTETTGETTYNTYDAFTRVAQTWRAAVSAETGTTGVSPVASYVYSPAGDRLATHTYTNGTDDIVETYAYDHRNRRIRKTVQRLNSSIAPPPSPPVGTHEWETQETHTFVWDGNNIVLERVEFANGTTRTFEYFWGADKSGSEQGAGGVEGLLAVSMDGVFYIPCYDHNGNIILYVSETGSIVTQYTYDPYGNIIDSSGPLADVFSFGFSTQYHDRETGMVGYQQRVYLPVLGRWLNRDPIEEEGGENLYAFCNNNSVLYYDIQGNIAPILIPVGEVMAEAALEAAAAAAAAALAAVAGTLAGEAISQSCKRCRPCDPPVGTLMYQIHTDHTHAGMNPHIHYFVVNQSPPDMGCRCFTPRRGSNVEAGDKPKAGAIPYRYPSGGGTY